jgi:DNA-binding NtrC family response regulator
VTTETVDELTHATSGHHAVPDEPELRLLYHPALARIGARAPCAIAGWLTVGRIEPRFGRAGAIDEPTISREQLRIRWQLDRARFAVEPIASARRAMAVVAQGGGPATPLDRPVELAPGAVITIGERIAIGLELSRVRSPDADRMGLIGESAVIWHLRDEIRSAGQFARPVLVQGPTGAGKELIARAVHRHGGRPAGPFIAINCAALPAHLVEATLFGHVKGAFTGAVRDEPGVFVSADGGTLFLDEIGELPPAIQPKLLRVLQEREVVPVGATRARAVDLRVVAATHRDLAAEVAAGRLREDLYHRLATHVLRVPALAERRFDVPELLVHMLGRLIAEHPALSWLAGGEGRPGIPLDFVLGLLARPWTGNVRELENVVERTARLNLQPGRFRAPDDVSARLPEPAAAPPPRPAAAPPPSPRDDDRVAQIAELLALAPKTVAKLLDADRLAALAAELDHAQVRRAAADALYAMLDANAFNQSHVAVQLGTSRTTVVKLIADLGLPRATDLDRDEIEAARARARGDLDATARELRVSPHALKKRLALLNLGGRRPPEPAGGDPDT